MRQMSHITVNEGHHNEACFLQERQYVLKMIGRRSKISVANWWEFEAEPIHTETGII